MRPVAAADAAAADAALLLLPKFRLPWSVMFVRRTLKLRVE